MNLPFRPPKKKKLQATAARRVREADYTEEPNVKLSSAFVVVLVLHVVAVGGIYAFNAIKAHQPAAFEDTETPQAQPTPQTVANTQAPENTAAAEQSPASTPAPPRMYRVKSGDTIARIASANRIDASELIDLNSLRAQGGIHVGEELKLPTDATPPAPVEAPTPAPLRDSGATYTVVHGDTPVGIARKLHVGYDDLIRLNKIEDPKKLKIGMKLRVPVKHPTA